MPRVTFLPSRRTVEVEENTSVYHAAEQAGVPVASSCNGNFVCGKCNIQVLSGAENLTEKSQPEAMLLEREANPETDRISCRTLVLGDCVVTTRYW